MKHLSASLKTVEGNDSGPDWYLAFALADLSFDNKETVENIFKVRHDGHEVRKTLPVVRSEAKRLQNASALKCGLSRKVFRGWFIGREWLGSRYRRPLISAFVLELLIVWAG